MLKFLLQLPIFLAPVLALAQRVNYPPAPSSIYAPYQQNASSQIKSTLWSDDVSTSANWSFSNTSLPNNDWTIETDSTIVSTTGLIQTTSSSNGFLLFRADTTQGATSESVAEYSGATIDLTGNPDVRIQFEQQYISDSNQRIIELSADGISWTPYFISDGNSATGARIDDLGSINVSSVIGNATTAFFRFKFSGTKNGYWAVDDIKINSIDSVDLRAVSVDWGTTGAWGVRMPYYSVIYWQIQPIEFCVSVANDGLLNVDTALFSVSIPVESFNFTDTFAIQSDQQDTICSSITFTPPSSGVYSVNQLIGSTSPEPNLLNNNIASTQFQVLAGNWIEYARDDVISGIQGGIVGSGLYEYEVGNMFDFFEDDYSMFMQVQIHPDAYIGAYIEGVIYSFDTITNSFIGITQTAGHTVNSSELGDYVNLEIYGGISLEANNSYLVTIRTYWHDLQDSAEIIIPTSGKSKPNTSFLRYFSLNGEEIFYLTETPMVRLLFSAEGLNEYQSNFNFNISPNPANEKTTLSFELPAPSKVHFEVIDLSGKTVNRMDSNHFEAGKNTFELTTNNLLNGVYFVKFTSDFGSTTKRIVIQH